jgi:hypothetical protein
MAADDAKKEKNFFFQINDFLVFICDDPFLIVELSFLDSRVEELVRLWQKKPVYKKHWWNFFVLAKQRYLLQEFCWQEKFRQKAADVRRFELLPNYKFKVSVGIKGRRIVGLIRLSVVPVITTDEGDFDFLNPLHEPRYQHVFRLIVEPGFSGHEISNEKVAVFLQQRLQEEGLDKVILESRKEEEYDLWKLAKKVSPAQTNSLA